jgi:hypothetical protein
MLGVLETAIRCLFICPVMFHLDSSFKPNINEFLGFVIGVSDAYQTLCISNSSSFMYGYNLTPNKGNIQEIN